MIKRFCDICEKELGPDHGFLMRVAGRNADRDIAFFPEAELCSIDCATRMLWNLMGAREPRRETWP